MPTTLHLIPDSDTAHQHVRDEIARLRQTHALQPVTLLLPSAGVIHDLREKLGNTMGVQLYQFYRLAHAVLDEGALPIHELNDAAIRRLLKGVLAEMATAGDLTTWTAVAEKPGFLEVVLQWVREMKSQGIAPETYAAHAAETGLPRDQQLATLYTRYQTYLHTHRYSDADGLLWVAAEALEGQASLFARPGPLMVLGFDQFTPIQRRLLAALEARFSHTQVYLMSDATRPPDSLALIRVTETRRALEAELQIKDVHPLASTKRSRPALQHLATHVFARGHAQASDTEGVTLIEAPSREAEVRVVLRQVKQRLLAGESPADLVILAPQPAPYLALMRTLSVAYGVPLADEKPLRTSPVTQTLLTLLQLAPDFPWRATLEALRSPYQQQKWLTPSQIEQLDQLSRERPVLAGRAQWAYATQPQTAEESAGEDEDFGPPSLARQLSKEELTALGEGLTAFFDHLMPPETASYRAYTWWVQTKILGIDPAAAQSEPAQNEPAEGTEAQPEEAHLGMWAACETSPFAARDLEAFALILRAMRHLLASVETVGRVETVPWDTYREELLGLLTRYHLPPDPHEARVQFAPLAEGRARPRARVYILGLAEGEFPARPAPDVFYAPAEREKHPLPLFQPSAADAASLWWQVLANTTEQLTLTRPYLDGNGAEWPPSPSWEAVTACFEALAPHRIPIAATPSPPQAANSRELSVALAQGRARQVPAEMESAWRAGQHGAAVMRQRASTLPAGVYEGQLLAPDLRDFLASKYRESHPWSASRLNAYPTCPYGFFAQYILQLEALPEPEEGLNAMQRGSLLHAILEDLYRAMAAQNLSPTLPNQTQVLALLEACGDARLPTAPQRYGFRPGPLWAQEQAELRRMLRAFVQWECEAHGETAAFEPWLQEAAFGLADGKPALPLTVEGVTFHLRGLIDRLDRDPAGNVRVVDYKSGSSTFSMNEIKRGTALQTVLYALAAQTLWAGEGGQVRESSYLHLPNRKKSGKVTFKDGERVEDNAVVQEGLGQAARSVQQVRAGHFPSAPAKPVEGWTACRPGCEKAALCRVTRASLRKASQAGDRA